MTASDKICIRGLAVQCIVGVHPKERVSPQPLEVDVDLMFDQRRAARSERLRHTVDYTAVSAQMAFLLRYGQFRLLETAAHVLSRYLLAPPALGENRAQIDEVWLGLAKPGALGGKAVPSLSIRRQREHVTLGHEERPYGTVDIVHETHGAGVYRLNVAPGRGIPLHIHKQMHEAEMVLSPGLLCQGQPVPAGAVHRWPLGAAHRYDNPTTRYQSILCVDHPRFIEADEIEVHGTPAAVPAEDV